MSTQIVFASKNPSHQTQFSSESELGHMLAAQKEYFQTDVTKNIDFRVQQLKRLKKLIRQYEPALLEGLQKDLGKAPMEGYLTEIMLVINEINYSIKKLKAWAKPKFMDNSFFLAPATSKIYYEPFGVCLIIAPWNYPILLSLRPLISAICAGNCITLKCSEHAPNTNSVILEMINHHFPTEYICAVDCGHNETEILTRSGYDFIFYTGNANTGKNIMKTAADTFTPVMLELGGKSPCIVDESADVTLAAKRIIWGKFINAGQSCVAPDFVYVHISRKKDFIKALENQIVKLYGKDPINNPDFGKIINPQKFSRLIDLLTDAKIIWGGNYDEEKLKIEPTLVEVDSFNEKVMKEEIFGPILPISVYKDFNILISNLRKSPKPLALYHFSKDKEPIQKLNKAISFGGGCVNDCVMQITNKFLPFGGVGQAALAPTLAKKALSAFRTLNR